MYLIAWELPDGSRTWEKVASKEELSERLSILTDVWDFDVIVSKVMQVKTDQKGLSMRDHLHLDSVPYEEQCEQLGPNYNASQARAEAQAFKNQLVRSFGEPPESARFRVMSNPHDFGSYYSVVIDFEPTSKPELDYAFMVEANLPSSWDAEARQELNLDNNVKS